MRKQLDPRIPTLIRNNVATGHRSFFVIVGDHARDQVVNLHFLLSQSRVETRPNVLWCYKKDLGFTTHRKKREAKIKRDIKRGIRDQDTQDPFELFVSVTDIRYCYYKDTPKILGRTFGMVVLQDFEAITPNLLARTIETVEGGGIVALLLPTMTSLRQLYSLSMDVHSRYKSATTDEDVVARFNERFLLSLSASPTCLFLDDELNVLPLSRGKEIRPLPETSAGQSVGGVGSAVQKSHSRVAHEQELSALQSDVAETKVVGDVIRHAKTLDQAKAVLTILDVLASSSLSTTVALTAGRGRGKSAALGLCLAAAIAHGYSNIFVTSPSPENLKTLFEFVLKGLDALGYEEVADWDLQRGTGEWKDVVVRLNVFRGHRQTIQYIQPQDHQVLSQAELVVIDEAAAIPLPIVRNLLGPYLVFLSSTVNGYEGTGRSLSLKLLNQLRQGSQDASLERTSTLADRSTSKPRQGALSGRSLKEVQLQEPIRYAEGDEVEAWLHRLLCLDASITKLPASQNKDARKGCPHPSECELYMVNRDTLFSYHPASEVFLQRIMALYVASHYKNSPNDLQLMSDAPAHALFVLLPPLDKVARSGGLPEPLCVLQVALEGNISRQAILNSLSRGTRDAGDLIPWLITQQFQDSDFAELSGARVVRIAVHPEFSGMGYGTRALQVMEQFYSGRLLDADALEQREAQESSQPKPADMTDAVQVRDSSQLPPLLERLSQRKPELLDWLGVSYGLTPSLFRFWKASGFVPLYMRQTPNELTGEYSTVQLKTIGEAKHAQWLAAFARDFRQRFLSLLGFRFREMSTLTALSVVEASSKVASASKDAKPLQAQELVWSLTPFDLKRLESYGNNLLELQVVLDLLPTIATYYFAGRLRVWVDTDDQAEDGNAPLELTVSGLSAALLLAIGLQRRTLDDVATELQLPLSQAHTLLSKSVRWIVKNLRALERRTIAETLQEPKDAQPTSMERSMPDLDTELNEAGQQAIAQQEAAQAQMRQDLAQDSEMARYLLPEDHKTDWTEAEARVRKMQSNPDQALSSTFSLRTERPVDSSTSSSRPSKRDQNSNPRPAKKPKTKKRTGQ
ncbi:N-acetyltransferase 10 [Malassezia psittaci]|uniref:RNA cytidine acetyltransferase n=1 Tax=Malassezia psittaci TaxID=1821823 RepID=A0AAF0JFP8_9BASI|nr:N-acetyltransferase 10 [Malassezia psittaci]